MECVGGRKQAGSVWRKIVQGRGEGMKEEGKDVGGEQVGTV